MRNQSSFDHACDELSSPDPLASSPNSLRTKEHHSKRNTSSAANRRSSAVRQSVESVSVLPPSSPSRTVTEQTLSPWKIRVTVEAEPEDERNGTVETITRTMKIPLRYDSSPLQHEAKPNRRSQIKPKPNMTSRARQRSTTPTAERRRRQSVTDLDIIVLGDDEDEDEWGKKPKRSSPRKPKQRKSTPQQDGSRSTPANSNNFEVRHDTDVEDAGHTALEDDSPELRQIDLNRVSVRARSGSLKQTSQPIDKFCRHGERQLALKPLPAGVSGSRRTVSANSALTYPTPSPTASERGNSVEVEEQTAPTEEHAEGFDTIMESEGFTMIDLETIPSVKQILNSPSETQSAATELRSPSESESSVRRQDLESLDEMEHPQVQPLRAIPPHLILPEGESDISSTVPSSPPVFTMPSQVTKHRSPLTNLQVPIQPRNRQVTPHIYSSPKLPSPPRQIIPKDRSTPDSAKVVKAALALQSAVQPTYSSVELIQQNIPNKHIHHVRSSSEELFEGFDSGTKRELRAGLRFGEELAKKQQPTVFTKPVITPAIKNASAQIWRGESVVSRTPVQESEQPDKNTRSVLQADDKSSDVSEHFSDCKAPIYPSDERRERKWQLKREAVSKRIQTANPNKVITIESDNEDGSGHSDSTTADQTMQDIANEDDDDIWLEEAKVSSSSPRQEREDCESLTQSEQCRQYKQAQDTVEKPMRNLIPSPWKRGEQLEEYNNSTMITNGDEFSGIMWKQQNQEDVQFGAAAINNIRREIRSSGSAEFLARKTSGAFDIGKMLGTPKRIRESLGPDSRGKPANSFVEQDHKSDDDESASHRSDNESEIAEEDEMSIETVDSEDTEDTVLLEPAQRQTIPVKFNDTTISSSEATPPRLSGPRGSASPSAARPPTPRSAIKGSRQSFGAQNGQSVLIGDGDQPPRRVIFAERKRGVDVDWVESSSSVQLSTEDEASSPIVQHQKHQEERQSNTSAITKVEDQMGQLQLSGKIDGQTQVEVEEQSQKGWLGWLWNKKPSETARNDEQGICISQLDGASGNASKQDQWQAQTSLHSSPESEDSMSLKVQSLPSYLLTPSYPSDPKRSLDKALTTKGKFTNTHFRTLHIIHRKSQRPRFHAPKLETCRPEIRALVSQRWKLEVDESNTGLGGFAWTVGETEAKVLERFCREVEFDHLQQGFGNVEVGQQAAQWLGESGLWSGAVRHGSDTVKWGWNIDQLATWLGRIVVGEVVREEEFGAKRYQDS